MAVHRFQPTHYHNTLGSHEPVLRIADGDVVETATVDAAGYDSVRQQVAAPSGTWTPRPERPGW
jgi:amidase